MTTLLTPWFNPSAFLDAGKRPLLAFGANLSVQHASYLVASIGPHLSSEHVAPRSSRLPRLDSTTRRTASGLFLATLAFAVFFWGLHYKLSLYRSNTAQHCSPEAKLLSQKERPVSFNRLGSVRSVSPQPQSSTFFFTFLIAAVAIGSYPDISLGTQLVTTDDDSRQQCRATARCFSSRPPPASLPSN